VVVRPHGADILPDGSTRRHPRLARRLRRSLQAADAVIAQGRFLKEVLLDLGVDAQRIYVIHNGVDIAAFAQAGAFDYPRPYMLGVGKFMRHKGFDVLLRAYARLRRPAADLLLAGQGPEQPRLERLAYELGIADRVKFLGFLSGADKLAVFKSAQFSICPSRREPFANVILEALASGLPVVASAVGGNTELIRDGVNGLLFPSEDDAALARALQHLLDQPALMPRLRAAIPALIRPFDWPLVAARYLALYQELAAQGRRRRAQTLVAQSDHAGLAGLARREQ
jgi:glycogen(starch) synthase